LRPDELEDSRRLILLFFGVRELKFNQPSLSLHKMSLIEIDDIDDRQWEGINYRVKESEEDSMSFYCQRFDAVINE
jgi:hypothetical protein